VSKGCSALPALGSSPSFGGGKNLRHLWYRASQLVLPQARRVRDLLNADHRIYLNLEVRRIECRRGTAVKRERLDFLVEKALHTKRFALYVARRWRSGTIRDVEDPPLRSLAPLSACLRKYE
jgi:hypothetical protein